MQIHLPLFIYITNCKTTTSPARGIRILMNIPFAGLVVYITETEIFYTEISLSDIYIPCHHCFGTRSSNKEQQLILF
jgi:hypothetical protein